MKKRWKNFRQMVKRMDEYVYVKQATKKGYIRCKVGGAVDLSYPNSQTRRGRVQEEGMICPTITAQQTGVCIIEKSRQDDDQ